MTDTYRVRPGDSLWHIARRHGVTVGELLVANPQLSSSGRSPDHIAPGETITLPPATGFSKAANLKSGTTECDKEKIRRKNIIFVGSEMYYDSFWLKMMFIAPAVTVASGASLLRTADETVIAYVDEGYTFLEKLPLEAVAKQFGHKIVRLADSAGVVAAMNDLPVTKKDGCTVLTKLQDVVFFCHGTPGRIALNYSGSTNAVDLSAANYPALISTAFVPDGKLFSYACRTGNSSILERFQSDAEASPELSLAQKLADHLHITVFAFLTRTWYGEVLRNPADSASISTALKTRRDGHEHEVIALPPEHEALPHPGLAEDGSALLGIGPRGEGTNGFALWRKAGARQLPGAASTPKGLSKVMTTFSPKLSGGG